MPTIKEVETSIAFQLIAEISDITHLTHKKAITAFAVANESGFYEQNCVPTLKREPE